MILVAIAVLVARIELVDVIIVVPEMILVATMVDVERAVVLAVLWT